MGRLFFGNHLTLPVWLSGPTARLGSYPGAATRSERPRPENRRIPPGLIARLQQDRMMYTPDRHHSRPGPRMPVIGSSLAPTEVMPSRRMGDENYLAYCSSILPIASPTTLPTCLSSSSSASLCALSSASLCALSIGSLANEEALSLKPF